MAEKPLDGKTALVTGAGRGLGKAICAALSEAGASVIAVARTKSDLEDMKNGSLQNLETWSADVTALDFPDKVEAVDTLDILVNNAGSNRPEPITRVSDENLDFILDLNVRALFRTARAGTRTMLRNKTAGVIINMSSQMGHVGSPNRTVYCMTKHAVEGLTKAMAVELAPMGIRVNSIAPTFVETPMTRPMLEDPAFEEFVKKMIPLGKMGQAEDIAAGVVYLASPAAAMVTGHSLVVDGGWTAQ